MTEYDWLKELEMLALKYAYLGINHDLSALTLAELFGLYCLLRSMG